MELLNEFEPIFGALVGVPAFLTMLINFCKQLGLVKDGVARKVSQGLNTVVFLVLFGLKTYNPEIDLGPVDELAGVIAQLGVGIIGLIPLGIFVSEKTHSVVRGLPIIGKSFDPEA